MEIAEVVSVPERPRHQTVLVALTGSIAGSHGTPLPVHGAVIASDSVISRLAETVAEPFKGDRNDLLRLQLGDDVEIMDMPEFLAAEDPTVERITIDSALNLAAGSATPDSLLGPDLYRVNAVSQGDEGDAHVMIGRANVPELSLHLSGEDAKGLSIGSPVIGAERLRRVGGDFFGFGAVDVEFIPDPEPPKQLNVELPLIRLHRPRHRGCVATYVTSDSDKTAAEGSVTIAGIGGGGGVAVTGTFLREYVTKNACIEIVVPASIRITMGTTLVDGTEVSYGMRADVLSVDPSKKKLRTIPEPEDGCRRDSATIDDGFKVEDFDQREAPKGGSVTTSLTQTKEVTGKLTVGLEFGAAPFKIALDYTRTLSTETTIETSLTPGLRYIAYTPNGPAAIDRRLEICWTTER